MPTRLSPSPNDVDALVVGAGVVGLAIARALALSGRSVIVLEANGAIGQETSSRNSEVIHAGLYYPTQSFKAQLCVAGRHALYAYCKSHNVPFHPCGKLIVATSTEEEAALDTLKARGDANGVEGLERLTGAAAMRLEPALRAQSALFSPATGILDSHAFMLSLQGEAEDHCTAFAFHTPFVRAEIAGSSTIRVYTGGREPARITTRALINAAGLHASHVARAIDGLPARFIPTTRYAKGHYFALQGRAPFSRLIYPAPHSHGLGIHFTRDLAGQARFGPDVEWVEALDYSVDIPRSAAFYEAIRRYWPALPDHALVPAYAGVRPKITSPDEPAADFCLSGPHDHGVSGLVNLFGIESPGLTAALAIAETVTRFLS